ncbi:MAG: ATP-binding protein [Microthrixaceae bacterium]
MTAHLEPRRRCRRPVAPTPAPAHAPPPPPSCSPPRKRNAGTPPKPSGRCSPRNSPDAKHPRSTRDARPPGSRPARPSTAGTTPSPRSPNPPSGRYAPSSGSTVTRTSSCAARRAPARATSSKRSATQAIDAGAHVSWFSLEALGALIGRHRADDTTSRAIRKIMRADVIIIDDIGLLPVTAETAEALYRVVDAAYEKRSIALSSNLHPAGFDELMPKTIANATVDRLLHHAHVVLTTGDSIRLTQATTGKGVTPLAN